MTALSSPRPIAYGQFTCQGVLRGHGGSVYALTVDAEGEYGWSWGLEETLKHWHLPSGHCEQTVTGPKGVHHLRLTPDRQLLLTCGWEGPIQAWTTDPLQGYRTYTPSTTDPQGAIANTLALHPQGRWMASGGWDKRVRLWDLYTGDCLAVWEGHQGEVNTLAFTPDGEYLISGSWDGTLRCWDLQLGTCIHILKSASQCFDQVAIAPDSKTLVASSKQKALSFWDIGRGRCRKTLRGHSKEITALFITPDNQTVITTSWDETIRFWDLATGTCFHQCHEHQGRIWTAALNASGTLLATGGQDKCIRLWQAAHRPSLSPAPELS